jgi:hypothetical protein
VGEKGGFGKVVARIRKKEKKRTRSGEEEYEEERLGLLIGCQQIGSS